MVEASSISQTEVIQVHQPCRAKIVHGPPHLKQVRRLKQSHAYLPSPAQAHKSNFACAGLGSTSEQVDAVEPIAYIPHQRELTVPHSKGEAHIVLLALLHGKSHTLIDTH